MSSLRLAGTNVFDAALLKGALLGALSAVAVASSLAVGVLPWLLPSADLKVDLSSWREWRQPAAMAMRVSSVVPSAVVAGVDPARSVVEVKEESLPRLEVRLVSPAAGAALANRREARAAHSDELVSHQASPVSPLSLDSGGDSRADDGAAIRKIRRHLRGEFLLALNQASVGSPGGSLVAVREAQVTTQPEALRVTTQESAASWVGVSARVEQAFRPAKVSPTLSRVARISEESTTIEEKAVVANATPAVVVAKVSPALPTVERRELPRVTRSSSAKTAIQVHGTPAVAAPKPAMERKAVVEARRAPARGDAPIDQTAASKGGFEPAPARVAARVVSDQPPRLMAVEAFQIHQKVASATFSTFSGSPSATEAEWVVTSAPNHVPTLSSPSMLVGSQKFLATHGVIRAMSLADNAASVLGALVGARVERGAGIVFGRIPAGWSMEFSGRSERVVFLGDDQAQLGEDDPARDRWFALMNVEPGMHILSLMSPWSGESASMSVPVVSGHATALPMATPVPIRLAGALMDGSVDVPMGLRRATVKRVGVEESLTATDKNGRFDLGAQLWIPGTTIDLEATPFDGFTHRYALRSEFQRNAEISLFAFPSGTVQSWISSLEGGVSDQSGIVVTGLGVNRAELDGLRARPESAKELAVGIEAVESSGNLVSEIYDLDGERRLRPAEAKSVGEVPKLSFRTVTVQVEPGLQRLQLESEGGFKLWSTLLVTSPGVLNVVTR